jgi:hypothetical protein
MKSMHRFALALVAVAFPLVLFVAITANAKPSPDNHHSGYVHALGYLRTARAYISHPDSGVLHDQEKNAIDAINQAIADIKAAGIDDKKSDDVSVDTSMRWIARLNKAADVLNKAHDEVSKDQDDASFQGLQAKTIGNIGVAHKNVEAAIALEQ